MASKKKTSHLFFMAALLAAMALASSLALASDMSIVDYNEQHEHGKAYNGLGEKEGRFEVFKDNLRFVEEHNAKQDRTYQLGMNRLADLTNEEYRRMYLGFRKEKGSKLAKGSGSSWRYAFKEDEDLPDQVDWREKGAVADVKDQGQCVLSFKNEGSCWVFSTVAAVEGINKIVTGDLITLSEQELVDCDRAYSQGCNGGLMDYAFEFIVKNGGIDTEEDYPYHAADRMCDPTRKGARVVAIDGYEDVPQNDEKSLKKAVAHQPVSVAIEAGGRAFQLYRSGVFTGICGTDLDHGVVVVGYGTDDGVDYWTVRNSWGPKWGEGGYIRLERNIKAETGKCGIAMEPSYPVKTGANPPNPGPSPPSPPVEPLVKCDEYYTCSEKSTCCCIYEFGGYCFAWGCCPLESATCCDDRYSCCPQEYPVCDIEAQTCRMSKDSPLGVKVLERSFARRYRTGELAGEAARSP
ncbi:hypothetical protein SAY87_011280 [Trapa incisa]|uniref:Cysteine protease n=1 Tax=Trapa incisa TaxID=236973 RepID=A0AAN7JJ28_9MYRT|nr:hypothetical protein SAY87_011280 [Trapa incisa]